MPSENGNHFQEYLDKMRELEVALKLVAYNTWECARLTRKTADYTLLTCFYVREVLDGKSRD